MGRIVVIGSSNTDMVVICKKMPAPGETVMGKEFFMVQGGKGANQAVAAARAGGSVSFIARVGDDDFGRNAVAGYKTDGINADHILIDQDMPSGIAVILVDEVTAQNSIVVASGANGKLSIDDILSAEKIISEADEVLIQLEIPIEVVEFSLRLSKKYGVKTVLNPAPAQSLSEDILSLVKRVNESVIITLGHKGVYFIAKNGENGFVPTVKVDAIDTTAAGDVFNGFLAAAISENKNFVEAISLANKAATISVTKKGAQPSIPTLEELLN